MTFGLSRQQLGTLLQDSIIELFELDFIGENVSATSTTNQISSLDQIDLLKLTPTLALPVDGSGNPTITDGTYDILIRDAIAAGETFMGVSRWCNFSGASDQPVVLSGKVKYPVTYRSTDIPPTTLSGIVQRGKYIKNPDDNTDLIIPHAYSPWPIRSNGISKTNAGTLPKYTCVLLNFQNTIGAILKDLKPYGAQLTIRRIYAKHLDGGNEPNWEYQFDPVIYYLNNWTIQRQVTLNFTSELEKINTNIPKRRIGQLR